MTLRRALLPLLALAAWTGAGAAAELGGELSSFVASYNAIARRDGMETTAVGECASASTGCELHLSGHPASLEGAPGGAVRAIEVAFPNGVDPQQVVDVGWTLMALYSQDTAPTERHAALVSFVQDPGQARLVTLSGVSYRLLAQNNRFMLRVWRR